MAFSLLVHMMNEEPFVADVESLPQPVDQIFICANPRRRDGKDVDSFLPEVANILIPWHRIAFIEVMPSESTEEIVSFVRE